MSLPHVVEVQVPQTPDALEVIDSRAASTFLQVHLTTIQELARRGEIPCRKVGKDYRFLRTALCQWLQGRTPQSPKRRSRVR